MDEVEKRLVYQRSIAAGLDRIEIMRPSLGVHIRAAVSRFDPPATVTLEQLEALDLLIMIFDILLDERR